MAKYEGIFKIKGGLGELVMYTLNGKQVVRRRSGFNAKDYHENPNYEGIRRNTTEFGHCSQVGKVLRLALSRVLEDTADARFYQRLTKVMTKIKDFDKAEKGKRTVFGGVANHDPSHLIRSVHTHERRRIPEGIGFNLRNDFKGLLINNHYFDYEQHILIVEAVIFPDLSFESFVHFDGKVEKRVKEISVDKHFKPEEALHVFGVQVGNWSGLI